MQPWSAVSLAFVVGCGFDTTPRLRTPESTTSADRNVPGLYKDGGGIAAEGATDRGALDAAAGVTASSDAASGNATSADASPRRDATADAARPNMPTTPVKPGEPPPPMNIEPADASVADSGKPPLTMPVTNPESPGSTADASTPAVDAATPPDELRSQLVTLLRAAEFTRDERTILGLVTVLVADAKSAADVQQILSPLETGGQCSTFGAALCVGACILIKQRCAVCAPDAACKTQLEKVCGATAANCN
jgi:hypothetical protein